MGCCGGRGRGHQVQGNWEVVDRDGNRVSTHVSSVQARVAAAAIDGARARPIQK